MDRPYYDLNEAKKLVSARKANVRGRARRFIKNRYGDVVETICQVFECIDGKDYYKTIDLEHRPGTKADIYKPLYDDVRWYVKFFVDGDVPVIEIWSCNWDGCMH